MENQVLTPHVYWAQRHRELYLRVELSDVQNPAISVTENVLHFKAQGHGAKGDNVYEFHLEFLDLVKPEPVYKLTQRQVNITVQKKVSQWWERLTKQEKRPLFLAPDFDRWLDESDAEMELRAKEEERLNKLRLESQGSPETLISLKKGYLFMYNLVQFLGFSWIFVNMTVRFFILGKESFYDTFHTVADMMYFCQMLAAVESINAAIGVTKTPVIPSLSQLLGRNFILFIVFGTVEEMQSKAVVFFVFYIWSTVEIFRYPFYMLSCIDMDWKVLTWLRYTVWIPLYPMGCLAEAVSVIQSIPIFNETGRFSFTLPYPVKIKVRFSFFLQIYLILLFLVADSLSRGIVTEVVTQLAARKKARKASIQAAARHQKAFCLTIGKPPIPHKGYYPFQKDFKPKMLQSLVLEERLYVNFRHLYKQRRRRFGQKKKKIH